MPDTRNGWNARLFPGRSAVLQSRKHNSRVIIYAVIAIVVIVTADGPLFARRDKRRVPAVVPFWRSNRQSKHGLASVSDRGWDRRWSRTSGVRLQTDVGVFGERILRATNILPRPTGVAAHACRATTLFYRYDSPALFVGIASPQRPR